MGAYPDKALGVLRSVALRMEEWLRQERFGGVVLPQIAATPDGRVSEEVCSFFAASRASRLLSWKNELQHSYCVYYRHHR